MSSSYSPPAATISGDIAITETLTGAILTDAAGDTIALSGTWTTYYDAAGAIDNKENAYLDITATGADGTTTFTKAYANNDGTIAITGSTLNGYEVTDNASSGSGGYNGLYLDWITESPTSLAIELAGGVFTSIKDSAGHEYSLTSAGTVTCFITGTAITTPQGPAAIETLAPGDLVTLADGSTAPIRWVGRRTVTTKLAAPFSMFPICIKAGALGGGLPVRDLLVSPAHAMLLQGVLVHAAALVNGTSIIRTQPEAESFTYYHIELAEHALVLAEGAPCESFVDNVDRMGFDNWAEHEALFGTSAPVVEMSLPRAKSARQVPEAIRVSLSELADSLLTTRRVA